MFYTFFTEGFKHIVSIDALDHQLYLLVLVVAFNISQWKTILCLVSAFTVAHTLSLFVSVTGFFYLNSYWVEILIALTIAITCIENLFTKKSVWLSISTASCFGFIHGLGFSASLKTMFAGMNYSLFETLLPFNIGVECGQIIVLVPLILALWCITNYTIISTKLLNQSVSIIVFVFSCFWVFERL